MDKDSKKLEPLVDGAVESLRLLFGGGKDITPDDMQLGRLASSVISSWVNLKRAEGAQQALYFSVARELARSPEQLAEYVAVTMPQVPVKALTAAKELPEGGE